MRKLVWFAVGFTAACAAAVYLQMNILCWLMALLCLLGFAVSFFFSSKPVQQAAAVFLGVVIGFSWLLCYNVLYLSTAKAYDGETRSVTVTATDYSYTPTYGQAFDGYVELDGKRYQVRCYLDENRQITPGQTVTGQFRLRYTGAEDEKVPSYYQGKGVFLIANQESEITVTVGPARIWDLPALWRQKILLVLDRALPADTAFFAKALLLGETSGFSYQQERAFQVSGLRHVVAVSGLHVSILFSLIYLAFGHRRGWNFLFGVPLLLAFAAVAGFTPSIVRACVMQLLMLLAMLVDKEYDPPTALAAAVLVILGVNPMAVTSVSFQLSVSCMVGIFAFSEPLRRYFLSLGKLQEKSRGKSWRARLIRWITGSVSVTLSAMAVTTPLCAIHFGMVSLVGIFSNLLTLWVIAFIFYGAMATAVLAALWLPLGQSVGWLISWPVRYVLGVSGLLARFPLAAVYTDSIYIVLWLIFSYVLLGAFFLTGKKHPRLTAAGIGLLLALCVFLSWLEPRLDAVRVSVIDVGQGQSVLVQLKDKHYLVDCGGDSASGTADRVANFLLSQGIFRLDGVILTHYDKDHGSGLADLLTVVETDRIYLPDIQDVNGIRKTLEDHYSEDIILIRDMKRLETNAGKITLYPGVSGANDNENSLCILFQQENCDILITGDRGATGERALLKQMDMPKVELLVAGHHGADSATSLHLLMATRPDAVAISVGADNRYGHPAQELLNRLSRFGCEVSRTDLQGTIIFRR